MYIDKIFKYLRLLKSLGPIEFTREALYGMVTVLNTCILNYLILTVYPFGVSNMSRGNSHEGELSINY